MTQTYQTLINEFLALPVEKIGKAISFIRFLEQEPELEPCLEPEEEKELYDLIANGETITAEELLAKIEAMPND